MFATVQLQVGELEVALVAPWVGTHEGTLLAAVRPDDGRSDAGNAPHVLPTPTKAFSFRVKARFRCPCWTVTGNGFILWKLAGGDVTSA